MANAVKIIYPDGREEELNKKLSLDEMQKIVGGTIQIVRSNINHRSLVVNENGIYESLEKNPKAYALLHPDFDWKHVPGYEGFTILGNAILIKS